jgi:thiol-disulfide isomerase/thioredoxin
MRWLIAMLALTVLAVTGCGTERSPAGERPDPIGTGPTADYAFTATTLSGETFDGQTLQGKPAVLWFWAPWCPTCRAQIGAVSALAEQYEGKVAVVGVGGLDSPEAIKDLAAEIQNVTHLVDADGTVWQHFGVTEQSSYRVIDAEGKILAEGYLDNDELITLVEQIAG